MSVFPKEVIFETWRVNRDSWPKSQGMNIPGKYKTYNRDCSGKELVYVSV
jgi:hypothetical protein